jgi:cytochrome c oxidase cbb3-type subunit 4
MDIGTFHGLWSLLILVIFIGIVAWAWSGKRKSDFEDAAHIPFDQDDETGQDGHGTTR